MLERVISGQPARQGRMGIRGTRAVALCLAATLTGCGLDVTAGEQLPAANEGNRGDLEAIADIADATRDIVNDVVEYERSLTTEERRLRQEIAKKAFEDLGEANDLLLDVMRKALERASETQP